MDNQNILTTTTAICFVLSSAFGWWYGWFIYHNPFDSGNTVYSVICGVAATLVLWCMPVAYVALMYADAATPTSAVFWALTICLGFVWTGLGQLVFQTKKKYFDHDRANRHREHFR